MIIYPTSEEVIYMHDQCIKQFGGTSGVRDRGALESALRRPQVGHYVDCVAEAAALFESLSQNHPFIDGNKRTAVAVTVVFLRVNGYSANFDDLEAYEFIDQLYRECRFRYDELEPWLRAHVRPCSMD